MLWLMLFVYSHSILGLGVETRVNCWELIPRALK